MYNNFDYEESLNKIKSALFDIYENQEVIVGSITDENKRSEYVEKYISAKNTAVELINKIESLYNDKIDTQYDNKPQIVDSPVSSTSSNIESDEPQLIPEDDNKEESDVDTSEEQIDNNDVQEENIDQSSDDTSSTESKEELEKIYYDNRNGDQPNFAYVSDALFNKIKNSNGLNSTSDNKIYKEDSEEPRGIIVRTDQFMKLSLSKHRQEGVLKEARIYRIEQARKSREQLNDV